MKGGTGAFVLTLIVSALRSLSRSRTLSLTAPLYPNYIPKPNGITIRSRFIFSFIHIVARSLPLGLRFQSSSLLSLYCIRFRLSPLQLARLYISLPPVLPSLAGSLYHYCSPSIHSLVFTLVSILVLAPPSPFHDRLS